jgi:serine/threonine-protein kinase RsbT
MLDLSFDNTWVLLESQEIDSEQDIVKIRQIVRHHAKQKRMGIVDQTRITTAVSELVRNMFQYAGGGIVYVHEGESEGHNALIVTCVDQGPGIEDMDLAMKDGFTSGVGMGLGLPGAKRLVDDFLILSRINEGTAVRVMKWI